MNTRLGLPNITFFCFVALLLGASIGGAVEVESELSSLELKQCAAISPQLKKRVCSVVTASRGETSGFSGLIFLTAINLSIFDAGNNFIQSIHGDDGYYDPEFEKLVITKKVINHRRDEVEFDLKTHQLRELSIK